MKKLANTYSKTTLSKETDPRWVKYLSHYLDQENEKENKALGGVYVNNDDEILFSFTLEEIREKYSVFLGLKEEVVEPNPENEVENKSEEVEKTGNEENEKKETEEDAKTVDTEAMVPQQENNQEIQKQGKLF